MKIMKWIFDWLKSFKILWSFETLFLVLLFSPLLVVNHFTKEFKAVFYILPFLTWLSLSLFQFFSKGKNSIPIDKYFIWLIPFYFVLSSIAVLFNPIETSWFTFWRDIVIISGPLVIFLIPFSFTHSHVRYLLIISMLCYLIWIKFDVDFVFLKSIFKSNFDMDHEYDYGTIVGLFILYFGFKRDYRFLFISLMFLVFANKRATYLGLLPALLFFIGIIQFGKIYENPKWLFFVLFSYYFSFYIISINLPTIASFFLEVMDKQHIQVDRFLTGRVVMIKELTPELYNRGILNYIFGNGPGQSDFYLIKVVLHPIYNFKVKPINPHNDFLKLHYDYGFIGVLFYFLLMYYMYIKSKVGILIFLYTVPLFLIENTLIYYLNIILACVLSRVDINNSVLQNEYDKRIYT